MANNLVQNVPDAGQGSTDFPTGKYLDKAAGIPGSAIIAKMRNDAYIFFNRLMVEANIVFNNIDDVIGASQFFDALKVAVFGAGETADWLDTTTYANAGLLVRNSEGDVFSSTGLAGNLNKPPSAPGNEDYWFACDDNKLLRKYANRGTVLGDAMHTIHDRSGANYRQNLLVGKKNIDGQDYEEHIIHLDGSVVTGNGILEGLLAGYKYLDLYAPDSLGTRTLVDKSSRHNAPISVGGENDILGQVLADQFQGHVMERNIDGRLEFALEKVGVPDRADYSAGADSTGLLVTNTGNPVSNGVDGTPRTGATTRPKEFTVGASYIIVQVAV